MNLLWFIYEWRYGKTIDSGATLVCPSCAVRYAGELSPCEVRVICWECFKERWLGWLSDATGR